VWDKKTLEGSKKVKQVKEYFKKKPQIVLCAWLVDALINGELMDASHDDYKV
jgi:hypothetical protein